MLMQEAFMAVIFSQSPLCISSPNFNKSKGGLYHSSIPHCDYYDCFCPGKQQGHGGGGRHRFVTYFQVSTQ